MRNFVAQVPFGPFFNLIRLDPSAGIDSPKNGKNADRTNILNLKGVVFRNLVDLRDTHLFGFRHLVRQATRFIPSKSTLMENLNSREGRVFDFHSIPSINPGSTLCLADSWTQVPR